MRTVNQNRQKILTHFFLFFLAIFTIVLVTPSKPAQASCVYNKTDHVIEARLGFAGKFYKIWPGKHGCWNNKAGHYYAQKKFTNTLSAHENDAKCNTRWIKAHDWVKVYAHGKYGTKHYKIKCYYKDHKFR